MANAIYSIEIKNLLVRDEESVNFHLEAGDYFGTLSAVMTFLQNSPNTADVERQVLAEMAADLWELQRKYKIIKKDNH
jgi:hypothetical protein